MATRKSIFGPWYLQMIDGMAILIIGVLAASGYERFHSSLEEQETIHRKVEAVVAQIEQLTDGIGELELRRESSGNKQCSILTKNPNEWTRADINNCNDELLAEVEGLEAEWAPYLRELRELADKIRALKEETDTYGRQIVDRNEEIESKELKEEAKKLEEKKADLERRLASLEAKKVRQEELTPGAKLGISIAEQRKVETEFPIILAKGRAYPSTDEFFAGSVMISDGMLIQRVKAKRNGLSVSAAFSATSPLMEAVSSGGFKKRGRVVFWVNNDSFAAFRVLRDKLVELGIDYAWEPDTTGTEWTQGVGGGGQSSLPSQGRSGP